MRSFLFQGQNASASSCTFVVVYCNLLDYNMRDVDWEDCESKTSAQVQGSIMQCYRRVSETCKHALYMHSFPREPRVSFSPL